MGIGNPHATHVENVNPFEVISYVGAVVLHPSSDNWTRTIYGKDNVRKESTGLSGSMKQKLKKRKIRTNQYLKNTVKVEEEERKVREKHIKQQQSPKQPNISVSLRILVVSLIMLKM